MTRIFKIAFLLLDHYLGITDPLVWLSLIKIAFCGSAIIAFAAIFPRFLSILAWILV